MKSVFSIFSVIIFCLLTLVSCASGTKSRELLYNNNDFAVYSVKRENLSLKSETRVPKTFAHPVQISEQKILDLLGNLKFRREGLIYFDFIKFIFMRLDRKDNFYASWMLYAQKLILNFDALEYEHHLDHRPCQHHGNCCRD